MYNKTFSLILTLLLPIFLTSCSNMHQDVLGTPQTQVQMRNYQSRTFDTPNVETVMRAVIATLMDLGFMIDKADSRLGTVTGTSYSNSSLMTVTVRNHGAGQTIVRANAQRGYSPIEDPRAYQNFFNALSQSLFLAAHNVD